MSPTRRFVRSLQRLLLVLCVPVVGHAASPLIDARLTVLLIQRNGQFEVTAAATTAKPGDVLEYTARYVNRGDAPAESLAPSMPIPVGTEYLPSDAVPKPTHASLDGMTFAAVPLRRSMRGPDGGLVLAEVPTREYRAVRWAVGTLDPGTEVALRVRVRVNQPTALAIK